MDHIVALLHKRLPELLIFRGVDGGGLRQNVFFTIHAVNIVGSQIHSVAVHHPVQYHMKGIKLHMIPFAQDIAQIAGAVGTQHDRFSQRKNLLAFLHNFIIVYHARRRCATDPRGKFLQKMSVCCPKRCGKNAPGNI